MTEPPATPDASAPQNTFINSGPNYGAQGTFYGSVQVNNHGTQVNLHALLHDHTGFMQDRLASFVGRWDELAEVQRRIAELLPTGGYVTITGQAGQGKSSLIAKLVAIALRERVGEDLPVAQLAQRAGPAALAYHFIPFQPGPDHQVGLLRNLMARLIGKYDLSDLYVASESRPALRDYFARVLIEVATKGGQEVIYLDGLDQIEEDASGVRDLSFLPTNPPAGIVFVLGTRPNDTLRPLELRKPHVTYWLPPLSRDDFSLILQHRGVTLDTHLADRFYRVMEANALYLDLVARELAQAGALPAEQIIAQVADNPENLFSLAVERLKRPPLGWREVIKPVLGLLLAAREPLRLRAIRTLIGQPDDAVQEGLERLGGLLQRDGEGRYTLFHLKLRDYLREDTAQPAKRYVFATDEEEQWHARLAVWAEEGGGLVGIWQDKPSDAPEQERRAYARLHYLAHLCLAREWSRLWDVLDAGDYAAVKLRHDPSTRSLVQDLDLVRQQMVVFTQGDFDTGLHWLPRLWRYSLLRCSLATQVHGLSRGLITLLIEQGRVQEAIDLAEVQPANPTRVLALNQIGKRLASEGRTVEAQHILLRAREIVLRMPAPHWDIGVIEVAEALAMAGQLDTALELVRSIGPAELPVEALAIIAGALAEAGRLEEARACAADTQAAALLIADIPSRVSALLTAATALRFAECADAALECVLEAREMLGLVQDVHQRVDLLGVLVEALVAAGQQDAAWNCVDQGFRAIAAIKDPASRGSALEMLADAALLVDEQDRLLEATRLLREENVRAPVLLAIVNALAGRGQPEAAFDLAAKIKQTAQRAQALVAVAAALLRAGQRDEARARAAEARDVARLVDNPLTRMLVLANVAAVLAQAGQAGSALELARSLDQASGRAMALWQVAEVLILSGQIDQARTCIDEANQQTRAIEDADARAWALLALAEGLADAGKLDAVRTCLAEATAATHAVEDAKIRVQVLMDLAAALARAGQPDAADEVARSAGTSEARVQRWLLIATHAGSSWKDATPFWAGPLADKPSQPQTGEVETLLKAGKLVRARVHALRASKLALSEKKEHERAWMLLDVVDALIKTEQSETARRCALEAGVAVRAVKIADIRAGMLGHVAVALAKTGQADPAVELARLLPEAQTRVHVLVAVVRELARAGWLGTGLRVARTIKDVSYRSAALLAVAEAQVQAGDVEEARRCLGEALGLLAQHDTWAWASLLKHAAAVAGGLPTPTALAFLHDHWPSLARRRHLLALLPAAAPLIAAHPPLLQELLDGFDWVDQILKKW
ncbi:MAG TPA: hypothetical protein VFS21_07070 [Roseiflexaceae bacterium]|nr:hypothetical protein [Roseiflexaceae bacterium]